MLIGLVALAVLAVATLRYCGPRVFWLAALAGHVGSALAVYAIIGAVRLVDPHLFTNALVGADFGVLAMQGGGSAPTRRRRGSGPAGTDGCGRLSPPACAWWRPSRGGSTRINRS